MKRAPAVLLYTGGFECQDWGGSEQLEHSKAHSWGND